MRAEHLEGMFEQTVGGHSGGSGGSGGDGGDGGGDGYEHTRQPERRLQQPPVDHWIVPGPKMKLEGPVVPVKAVNVPDGWLGMRRKSTGPPPHQKIIVLKKVAVRGLPRASAVDVMEHAWLTP
jgi:hypothetical protein